MTIYYVSPSPTGNDNNAGTSGAPFATITHAATRCVAGDTVLVNDGTYHLSQATYVNGAAGSPITYKAVNKGQAKIIGTTDDPWYNQGNYVVIDGFDITNGVTNGIHGIDNYGSNVTIQNCIIHDILLTSCPSVGGAAIFDGGYNNGEQVNVNILNNTIYNIGPMTTCLIVHGIYQTCSGGIIANNIVYGVCGYAVHLWHAATDQVVVNNLFFAGRYGGVLVGNDGTNAWATVNNNTIVANNIFYNNPNYGFREFGNTGTNNRYINNTVFGSSTVSSILTGQAPVGTITADPAFVNYQADGSGDYHLSSTSPCIGTGSPVGAYITDRDGNARPTRPFRYDIGPYVYLQTIGVLPGDANLQRALGVYDPTSHKVVAVQAGTTSTDGTTGIISAPLSSSSSGSSGSNASVGTTGSAIPTSATLAGASDGTNLQQLLVESSTNKNLRVGIYQGSLEVSVTGANALKVDASATTQPVSGTITANAGTGNFNNASVGTDGSAIPTSSTLVGASDGTNLQQLLVESASNRNLRIGIYQGSLEASVTGANALKVDGSAVTQPISAASLPLPSGAATAAKQPALGTAGTPSADVLTVQGTTSMIALKVDGSGVTQPVSGTITANIGTANGIALDTSVNGILQSQGSTTSGQKGPLIQGAVTSAAPSYTTAQSSPLSLTTAGALRVDSSAVTQPVSAASLPLPTGASTSAKQPALGTAGTPSTDVLTVQGIASMTALKVDGSAVTQPVSGTVTANAGTGSFNNASVGSTGSAIPSSASLIGASDGTNLQQLLVESSSNKNLRMALYNGANEAAIDSSGNQYIRGNFSEQASLSAGSLNADLVASTDVSAYKWFSLQVTGTWSGTLTFQASNDNSNFVSIYVYQLNNVTNYTFAYTANAIYTAPITFRYLRVRMTSYSSGTANGVLELYTSPPMFLPTSYVNQSNNWNVGLLTNTTGGSSDFHLISAASTNATSIKASAGQVYGYEIYNSNAAVRYVKLYNKASTPTVGTDTPFRTIGVPANGRASFQTAMGLAMGIGIALATTTGIADSDSTAVGASDLSIEIDWK